MAKRELQKAEQIRTDLLAVRSDWEPEWIELGDYLYPGRGINRIKKGRSSRRRHRSVSPKSVNTKPRKALNTLAALLQSGLTSSARKWFMLEFDDKRLNQIPQLKAWLEDATNKLLERLAQSNFYSEIATFYREYAGYATSAIMMLEDSEKAFRFEPVTIGDYVFQLGSNNLPLEFFRELDWTLGMIVDQFGEENLPEELQTKWKNIKDQPSPKTDYYRLIHSIYRESNGPHKWTSCYYLEDYIGENHKPLLESGYNEFPGAIARWETIGSDPWGNGPGHEALPNIKRLQQMEKGFAHGVHKSIDPPLNVPSELRGTLDKLPGGVNYYSQADRAVTSLYDIQLNFEGVSVAIERVERQIQSDFYNDLLLTASRDPDASPLRTGQVEKMDQEKLIEMAPMVQRLQTEAFEPIIERGFNILLRRGEFQELPPDLAELVSGFKVRMVSPLAQAQKQLEARTIESFMAFVGGMAQFKQEAMDKINVDETIDQYGDIIGVPSVVINSNDRAQEIRTNRAQAMAQREAEERQAELAKTGSETRANDAQTAKALSEAGLNLNQSGFTLGNVGGNI